MTLFSLVETTWSVRIQPFTTWDWATHALGVISAMFVGIGLGVASHEAGHYVVGLLCGVRATGLYIGGGRSIELGDPENPFLRVGPPWNGAHVHFQHLPVSKAKRLCMYFAGVAFAGIAGVAVWLMPYRTPIGATVHMAMALMFVLPSIDNLLPYSADGRTVRHASSEGGVDRIRDGQAIKGLAEQLFGIAGAIGYWALVTCSFAVAALILLIQPI